jgi:hypothetical protein
MVVPHEIRAVVAVEQAHPSRCGGSWFRPAHRRRVQRPAPSSMPISAPTAPSPTASSATPGRPRSPQHPAPPPVGERGAAESGDGPVSLNSPSGKGPSARRSASRRGLAVELAVGERGGTTILRTSTGAPARQRPRHGFRVARPCSPAVAHCTMGCAMGNIVGTPSTGRQEARSWFTSTLRKRRGGRETRPTHNSAGPGIPPGPALGPHVTGHRPELRQKP